jgi:multidrug efflux pump subunit AcrA (membrane-fusion protein)
LLVFKCKADYEDAILLDLLINSISNSDDSSLLNLKLPKNLLLGELQDDYYDFLRKQETFNYMYGGNLEQLNVIQLERKIQTIQSSLQLEQRRKSKLAEQLDLAYTRQSQEEMNVESRLLDPEILSQTKEDILQLEREMQVIEGNIKDKQFEIETVRSNISGVKTEASENLFSASSQMKDAFVKLRNSLKDWKKSYLVTAPIDGIVLYANEKIGEQQFVSREAELLMVVPLNRIETIGRMMVPVSKSAKIEEHQKVVVRLDGYPQYEYGIVKGEVMWKGIVPNNGEIPVEIRFPDGLVTSTGEAIEPKQAMSGNADIILAEKRLIQRIFETARNLSF